MGCTRCLLHWLNAAHHLEVYLNVGDGDRELEERERGAREGRGEREREREERREKRETASTCTARDGELMCTQSMTLCVPKGHAAAGCSH